MDERANYQVLPDEDQVFAALAATPFDAVKVVIGVLLLNTITRWPHPCHYRDDDGDRATPLSGNQLHVRVLTRGFSTWTGSTLELSGEEVDVLDHLVPATFQFAWRPSRWSAMSSSSATCE